MAFDSREYEYADCKVMLLGIELTGLRGIKYKKSQEKEVIHGAGNQPKAIQRGQKKYEGTLMLLQSDVDILNKAAAAAGYEDITDVPGKFIDLTCLYQKSDDATELKTDTCQNVEFTELEEGMNSGDKFKEISLPFIFLRLKKR